MFSKRALEKFLKDVKVGKISIQEGLDYLTHLPYEDLGFAKIDHHRHIRRGFPEVIFAPGKSFNMLMKISANILSKNQPLMITKVSDKIFQKLKAEYPNLIYHENASMITSKNIPELNAKNKQIAIITAGTSDIPVAEEAKITCEFAGYSVETIYDVGVAGIHRLSNNINKFKNKKVIIVVAGMEGALASVIGGITSKPIIAVPTSVGYGASFKGLSALLTMLNCCAPGVCVVNIDNGFGAGYLASMILRE